LLKWENFMVQEHNAAAAAAWGHAGANYDFISFGLSDGLSYAVQALWPVQGERILDIATGTGWTARLAAGLGAEVVGIDIADALLQSAVALSTHLAPSLSFRHADAEELPFDDGAFDGVISTYGVIFAGRPDIAASELARVTKKGGRMVLLTWYDDSDGYIAQFFAMVGHYADRPGPDISPFVWGDPDWISATFSDSFDITTEKLTTTLFAPDSETLWHKYRKGFGPMDLAASTLSLDRLTAFQQDFHDLHARHHTGRGLRIERKALLVRGRKR
jgi:SAM-dependent methyltransferase